MKVKILIIHNQYQIPGGEDAVANSQYSLLSQVKDIQVDTYFINNNVIKTFGLGSKIALFLRNILMLSTIKELKNKIDEFKPDIAHVHNIYPLINPSVFRLLHKKKIKIVQTLHNYRFLCPNGSFYRDDKICNECSEKKSFYPCIKYTCYKESKLHSSLYAHMITQGHRRGYFKYIDKFVALNAFMKDKMVDYGFEENKFEIIPNGFAFDIGAPREHDNYYLYIGRLGKEKGIATLCEAFLGREDTLKIMGGGELEEYVRTMATACSNIEYIGYKSGEEKNQILSRAKAIIVPSQWYENLPTVIIEAFSKGVPVIVSRLGGAQYMVESGKTGFTFEAGNIQSLQDAITQLNGFNHKQRYKDIVDKYVNLYSTEAVTPKLLKLYDELFLTKKEQ